MLQVEELINKNFIEAQNLEKLEESKPKPEKKEEKEEKKEARIPGPTLNPSLCTSPKTLSFFQVNKVKVNPNNESQKKLSKDKETNKDVIKVNVEKSKKNEILKQENNKKILSLLTASVPIEKKEIKNETKKKFVVEESKNNILYTNPNANINLNTNTIMDDIEIYDEPYTGYDFDYSDKDEDNKFLEKKRNRIYNEIPNISTYQNTYQTYTSFKDKVDSGTQTVKNVDMINRGTSCERTNINPTKVKILNLIDEYSYQEVFDALMKYYFPNYNCEYNEELIERIARLKDISLDQIVSFIISIGNSRQEVIKVNIDGNKEKEPSSQEEEIDYEDNDNDDIIEIMEHEA